MPQSLLGSVVWGLEFYGWCFTLCKLEVVHHNMSSGCGCYNNVLTNVPVQNLNSKKGYYLK